MLKLQISDLKTENQNLNLAINRYRKMLRENLNKTPPDLTFGGISKSVDIIENSQYSSCDSPQRLETKRESKMVIQENNIDQKL